MSLKYYSMIKFLPQFIISSYKSWIYFNIISEKISVAIIRLVIIGCINYMALASLCQVLFTYRYLKREEASSSRMYILRSFYRGHLEDWAGVVPIREMKSFLFDNNSDLVLLFFEVARYGLCRLGHRNGTVML